jgi:cytidylate kinase
MYKIITVEREFGSGAGDIARELASRLGWKLWDNSLTEEVAKIANVDPSAVMRCDERVDSTLYRLGKVFWRGSHERSMQTPGGEPFDADCMVAMMRQVVEKAADGGQCVIVGRGAPYFLRQRPDAFHVFLYAPRAEKIRRLRELGKGETEAETLVDTIDRDRILFVKHYFGADWPTRSLYHMMVNTSIGNELVLETILHTMHSLESETVQT